MAGVESMSRVKRRGFNWSPHPVLESGVTEAYVSMGATAENVARMYGISREEQEAFALMSHTKAADPAHHGSKSEGLFVNTRLSLGLEIKEHVSR